MDHDILNMFKEKNRNILINSLKYDIEKNITSLLETIINIFNHEFDVGIKNIRSIYEDGEYTGRYRFVTDTINQMKMDSYREIEVQLEKKKLSLEEKISHLEFTEDMMREYYDFVLETTKQLKDPFIEKAFRSVREEAMRLFERNVKKNIVPEKQEITLKRIQDYLQNRLYGKLETKLHMEIMLRDNNLINKAKEGYLILVRLMIERRLYMKSTGVIRRIDDLGRIVIPKEIRKNLKIREGDTLEFYISGSEIILKKFSLINEFSDMAIKLVGISDRLLKKKLLITDHDKVIACSKELEKRYLNKEITSLIQDKCMDRMDYLENQESSFSFVDEEEENGYYMISPVIVDSDVLGSVILFDDNPLSEQEMLTVKMFNAFLTKNIEE